MTEQSERSPCGTPTEEEGVALDCLRTRPWRHIERAWGAVRHARRAGTPPSSDTPNHLNYERRSLRPTGTPESPRPNATTSWASSNRCSLRATDSSEVADWITGRFGTRDVVAIDEAKATEIAKSMGLRNIITYAE